jgi:protoporphyrinogen oxidase
MRDVVIIGGGLSGLAAAHELQSAGVPYTLIEVKNRLGGSIETIEADGFGVDAGSMLSLESPDAPILSDLGLAESVYVARVDEQGEWIAFKQGTGALIDALRGPLTGSIMMRMAVSTIGQMDSDRFAICMENGMVLDARAIIVAAPARYAERIFHTLRQEISHYLLDYRYDSIARVSLGYRRDDVEPIPMEPPPDFPVSYVHYAAGVPRVPEEYGLVQAGVRFDPGHGIPPDVVGELAALMGWPQNPVMERVTHWPEGDPLMWLDSDHEAVMKLIQVLLPDGVAIAGSDYIVTGDHRPTLQERIDSGQAAARRVLKWLRER